VSGIEKRAARLHHLGTVSGIAGAFMLHRQKIYVAFFRHIKLMSLRTGITFI
jgi:hypothetical protein